MEITRRQFVKGGVAAFTVTFAAPEFLSDLARAQGSHARNLVVLYLSGGNDALSMLVPYADSSPTAGAEAAAERSCATRLVSHPPASQRELAFVYGSAQAALSTLDRVATVATYAPSVTYPNAGFGQALRAVAGAMYRSIG